MHKLSSAMLTVAIAIAIALAAPVLSITMAPAANAADPGLPVLVSPSSGSTIPSAVEYDVVLDMSQVSTDSYWRIDLECDGNGATPVRTDGYYPEPITQRMPAMTGPQTCAFTAYNYSTGEGPTQIGNLNVAAPEPASEPPTDPTPPTPPAPPVLALSGFSISATSFYPRVVDNYRDTVTTRWTSNRAANTSIAVLNSRGTAIRRQSFIGLAPGAHSWAWNGRMSDRRVAAVGMYRVRVTAAVAGVTRTFTRSVAISTALVNRSGSAARDGDVSSVAASDSCYVTQDSYNLITSLDCWGGRYAMANYNFRVPASAFNVHWSARGTAPVSDICCDGRITRTGKRLSSTLFQIRAQVSGWRAFDVDRAAISYTYKVRR